MAPDLPGRDGIVGAFARLVARRASDEVVVSPGRRATFGEIDSLSRVLSERIAAEAIERGCLVGLAAPNGPAFLAGFLALRRAGQVALLLDPRAPFEDRRRALTVLGTTAVLECTSAWPTSTADFRLSREGRSRGRESRRGKSPPSR